MYSGWWDPVLAACVETDTVVCRVGSSGMMPMPLDAPDRLGATLFGALSLDACANWLWSGVPVRFPGLKIAMSEGGVGWIPMLVDRLDLYVVRALRPRPEGVAGPRHRPLPSEGPAPQLLVLHHRRPHLAGGGGRRWAPAAS